MLSRILLRELLRLTNGTGRGLLHNPRSGRKRSANRSCGATSGDRWGAEGAYLLLLSRERGAKILGKVIEWVACHGGRKKGTELRSRESRVESSQVDGYLYRNDTCFFEEKLIGWPQMYLFRTLGRTCTT